MKKYVFLSLLGACMGLASCSDDTEPVVYPNDGNLLIATRIYSNLNNFAFDSNERMGLFLMDNGSGERYATNPSSNVMATALGQGKDKWILGEDVPLGENPAMIYAYYPYDAGVVSPYRIPVSLNRDDRMVDYMYGANDQKQKINRENPKADLIMNHALSMIQFDLSIDPQQPYYGTGVITDAEIVAQSYPEDVDIDSFNGAEYLVQNKHTIQDGYLNCITGYITPIHWGSIRMIDLIGKDFHRSYSGKYPCCMVAPVYRMENTSFRIQVDGKDFYLPLPDGTTWAKNTKNRYNITLSGMELRFQPDALIVEDWTVEKPESGEFGGMNDF